MKKRKSIITYFLELLIVAFGVFLGIYIGDRNNQRKTDANTDNALTQIISEMEGNAERLASAISYHEKVSLEVDSATSLLNDQDLAMRFIENKKFQFTKLPSWTGSGSVLLSNSIYESAKIGGVFQELNLSTLELISSAYGKQKYYISFNQSLLDKFIGFDSSTKTTDVVGLLRMITKYDNLNLEKALHKLLVDNKAQLEEIRKDRLFKK